MNLSTDDTDCPFKQRFLRAGNTSVAIMPVAMSLSAWERCPANGLCTISVCTEEKRLRSIAQHTAQHTGDGDSPLWRYWVSVEEDMSSSGSWVKWCIRSLLHGRQFIPHGPTMSVYTKVMSKGVHNIAFSVTPDMFWPISLWEWLRPLPYAIWCPNPVIVLL